MEMFLMVVCIAMFGLGVTCMAFSAAAGPLEPAAKPEPKPEPVMAAVPARFFARGAEIPLTLHAKVPIEVLLLQIENHVRLEQAAAESFIEFPTAAMLHGRTMSQLIH
jgi:hypothetical protein